MSPATAPRTDGVRGSGDVTDGADFTDAEDSVFRESDIARAVSDEVQPLTF